MPDLDYYRERWPECSADELEALRWFVEGMAGVVIEEFAKGKRMPIERAGSRLCPK